MPAFPDVTFVTKDINARVKADALGIRAEDFRNRKVNFDELYNGWSEHVVADEIINAFYAGEAVQVDAEFHPNAANDSPENRARNRRVDVVILSDATAWAEEPGAR